MVNGSSDGDCLLSSYDCHRLFKTSLSMNAATSVQETLPLEGANPCHFLVMYEDGAAHDLAMEVCGGMMNRFGVELAFAFSFWSIKDLSDPVLAHWATEAVARADIILFSLPGQDLTPATSQWLDTCILTRTKTEGALALMVTETAGAGLAIEALLSRLQLAAHRLRMDFLPLLPLPSAGVGRGAPADVSLALLNRAREEPGSNHWGLNE